MKLNVKALSTDDYDNVLTKWWKDWDWTPPVKEFLPQEGTGGVMVYDDDIPVCAGFIYTTNSSVAWIDWIISNKDYKEKESRKEAIKMLISTLSALAKNKGYMFGYALLKHSKLIETYEELGFTAGDSYNKEMIKVL